MFAWERDKGIKGPLTCEIAFFLLLGINPFFSQFTNLDNYALSVHRLSFTKYFREKIPSDALFFLHYLD